MGQVYAFRVAAPSLAGIAINPVAVDEAEASPVTSSRVRSAVHGLASETLTS